MKRKPGKPDLAVIEPSTSRLDPPPNLGEVGTALWQSVQTDPRARVIDIVGMITLETVCQAADFAEAMNAAIQKDGLMIKSKRGGPRAHPLISRKLALDALVLKGLIKLRPKPAQRRVGRPGFGGIGWMPDDEPA